MKKTVFVHLLSVALVGSLLLSGCQKEKTGFLRLNAERITSNEKTYVDTTTVKWLVGDQVWVNGTEYVLVNDNTISGTPIQGDLLAIYPSSIIGDPAPSNNQVAVTIPSVYTYETDVIGGSTKQILAMPMVGVAAGSATSMTMKHLCSAMQITVTNGFGEELVLDSIILRGSGLSGSTTVNPSSSVPAPGTGSVDYVLMDFTGNTTTIASNGNLTVQIPVLPVSSPCTTWVSIRGHLATSGRAFRYSRSTNIELLRAKVHAAPVTMTTPAPGNHMEVIIPEGALPGIFTVSNDGQGNVRQIYFSKGNLQYKNGTGWRFAEHQYDYRDSWNTSDWVDWFSWGIWTGSNPNPTSTSTSSWDTNDFQGTIAGAPGTWRTLKKDEWVYLINKRAESGISYLKASITVDNTSYNGLILFPDNYVDETGTYTYNNGNSDYTPVDATHWATMESIGAVFLPAAGYRGGRWNTTKYYVGSEGHYWSSILNGDNNAYGVFFDRGSVDPANNGFERRHGRSVRLVQDI